MKVVNYWKGGPHITWGFEEAIQHAAQEEESKSGGVKDTTGG